MISLKMIPVWGWVLIVLLIVSVVWAVGIWWYAAALETPGYRVLEKNSEYEIREYDPILVAQVEVSTAGESGINEGFMQLAGFIFGDNKSKESVAMTTPVLDQPSQNIAMTTPVLDAPGKNKRTVTFTIPEKWDKDTLPIPNNQNIQIVEWPAQKKAVRRFIIWNGNDTVGRKQVEAALLAALEKEGIEHEADVTFAFYNPPWTPFFLRRNEVMVTLPD